MTAFTISLAGFPISVEALFESTRRFWAFNGIDLDIRRGKRVGIIGVYRSDELGRMISLDHITRAFKFEVKGIPIWYTGAHGYMRLPQMQAWQEI